MITRALIIDTFREAMARRIFWGLFGLTALILLFFLLVMRIDVVEGAVATMTLFGNTSRATDLTKIVNSSYAAVAAFLYSVGMFLAVFASAGLIPSVLEPGRIELILSKPITRAHLLLGRYVGNVLVVAVNIVVLVLGAWTIFGAKTGIWKVEFLITIPATLFIFSVLLAVVVLVGVLFESTAVSTMVPVVMMILSPILAQDETARKLLSSEWSRALWRGLYWTLPKVFDTGRMTLNIVLRDGSVSWWPIWTSGLFAIVVMACALWRFEQRDF
jgi:ABC-type transport system involved in multi-copper enzyme maturation permease subunit